MKRLFYILTAITCMGQQWTLHNPVILTSRQGGVATEVEATSANYIFLETGGIVLMENGVGAKLEWASAEEGSGTSTATNILTESGSILLLENGNPFILE